MSITTYRKESIYLFLNPDGSFRDGQINRIEVLTNGRVQPAPHKSLDEEDIEGVLATLNGTLLTQRDALATQVSELTTERDSALGQVEPLQAQIAALQAQLDAILNPPGPDISTVEGAKQYIAAVRYERESGGITVGEQVVTTFRDEMPLWLGMLLDISMRPGVRTEFEYKPRGSAKNVLLTAQQVLRCYECVAWYVQACFTAERLLADRLDQGEPIDDVLASMNAAWPQAHFEWVAPQ